MQLLLNIRKLQLLILENSILRIKREFNIGYTIYNLIFLCGSPFGETKFVHVLNYDIPFLKIFLLMYFVSVAICHLPKPGFFANFTQVSDEGAFIYFMASGETPKSKC